MYEPLGNYYSYEVTVRSPETTDMYEVEIHPIERIDVEGLLRSDNRDSGVWSMINDYDLWEDLTDLWNRASGLSRIGLVEEFQLISNRIDSRKYSQQRIVKAMNYFIDSYTRYLTSYLDNFQPGFADSGWKIQRVFEPKPTISGSYMLVGSKVYKGGKLLWDERDNPIIYSTMFVNGSDELDDFWSLVGGKEHHKNTYASMLEQSYNYIIEDEWSNILKYSGVRRKVLNYYLKSLAEVVIDINRDSDVSPVLNGIFVLSNPEEVDSYIQLFNMIVYYTSDIQERLDIIRAEKIRLKNTYILKGDQKYRNKEAIMETIGRVKGIYKKEKELVR